MGYTHYWVRKRVLPPKWFRAAVADCQKICQALGIPLGGADGLGEPVFTADRICFNGRADSPLGNAAYETFLVDRVWARPHDERARVGWEFCKTEHRPYDLSVQCCLIALSHRLGPRFRVSSDGDTQHWQAAREACQRVLGYGVDWGEEKLAVVAAVQDAIPVESPSQAAPP
jgi:hypothetical protein